MALPRLVVIFGQVHFEALREGAGRARLPCRRPRRRRGRQGNKRLDTRSHDHIAVVAKSAQDFIKRLSVRPPERRAVTVKEVLMLLGQLHCTRRLCVPTRATQRPPVSEWGGTGPRRSGGKRTRNGRWYTQRGRWPKGPRISKSFLGS